MMLLKVLEFTLFAVVVMFLAQQIVLPLWRGRLIFPMFREEGKLEDKLAAQAQARHEAALRAQLKEDDLKPRAPKTAPKPKPSAK